LIQVKIFYFIVKPVDRFSKAVVIFLIDRYRTVQSVMLGYFLSFRCKRAQKTDFGVNWCRPTHINRLCLFETADIAIQTANDTTRHICSSLLELPGKVINPLLTESGATVTMLGKEMPSSAPCSECYVELKIVHTVCSPHPLSGC